MGRPSRAAERTEQIMQATGRCLRTYGLVGTTLERVAEESGLSRSHVRHYVGNRDDLLRSFATWLYTGYEAEFVRAVAESEARDKLPLTMDYLFGQGIMPTSDDDTIIRELVTAGLTDTSVRTILQGKYQEAVDTIGDALAAEYPTATPAALRSTAYGLWCLALGNSMIGDLGLPVASGGLVRTAADALLDQLALKTAAVAG
ncbi:TetR/AcrR family transcriptional regulator [Cryptosporangium aurantiacum]|uniref:Transcriptional regulator, TetR family n=1 Tax=Cryptosporangium aurantiacum TaxID=134849 RepID=A0A1M7PRQ3_9ACTN|nr:TetR family transcriptional regulator [Cryptosporangium aurantiacum]SHN20125.1 transcriptional regulator, TetR family [Cryptosporangium aurantiacum]